MNILSRNGEEEWQKVIGEHAINIDFNNEIKIEIHFGIYNSKFKIYGQPLTIQNPLGRLSFLDVHC